MSSPGDEKLEFTFRKCLGAGGFGEVYLAEHYTKGGLLDRILEKLDAMGVSVDAVNVLVASPPPFGVSEGSCSWVAVAAPMGVWEIVGE